MPPPAVQFGEFELDSAAFELRRKGRTVRLERLPLELILLLVSRKGELVTRDEIARKLWGDDVYVDTNTAINVVVRKARQALRDDADDPKFLLTVPSKGYRFVGTVSEDTAVTARPDTTVGGAVPRVETAPDTIPDAPKRSRLRSWMVWTALGVLALTTVILGRTYLRRLVKPSARRI